MDSTNKLKIKIITDLYNLGGYIKGYGPKQCRVMDNAHNPLYNVSKNIINELIQEDKLYIDNIIYKLKVI